MAAATFSIGKKENLGSVYMVRAVAEGDANDVVIDASEGANTFTAKQFGLTTVLGGFATSKESTYQLAFVTTSTGFTLESSSSTSDVLVSDDVAITVFGK